MPSARPLRPPDRPRRGFTAVEATLGLALGLGVLGLVVSGTRFLATRTTSRTSEILRTRRTAIFLQRLRRILRYQAVAVAQVEGGVRIVYRVARPGVGPGEALEEIWFLAPPDQPGTLVIVEADGTERRYDVGAEIGPLEVVEDVAVRPGVVQVRLGGEGAFEELVPASQASAQALRPFVRPDAEVPEPAILEEQLEIDLREWVEGLEVEPEGEAEVRAVDAEVPVEEAATGEIPTGSGAARSAFDDEVDLMGIEISPIGQVFLPPVAVSGVSPTGIGVLTDRLRDGGMGTQQAGAVAELLRGWEEAVRQGDRRGAGEAIRAVTEILEQEGGDASTVAELVRETSDVGRQIWDRSPGAEDIVATATSGAAPPFRLPDSLGTRGVDPVVVAELPGQWTGPGTGPPPGDGFPPPAFPGDPTPVGTPGATPVGTPGATPVGTPGATPVGTPGATPVGTPGATPVGTPGATPVGTPVGTPGATPVGTPGATPVGTPGATPPGTPGATPPLGTLPPTPSGTPGATPPIGTLPPTPTPSASTPPTPTPSSSPQATPSPTAAPTPTPSPPTPTPTPPTPTPPSPTPMAGPTPSPTGAAPPGDPTPPDPTPTPSPTPPLTPRPTPPSPSPTPTPPPTVCFPPGLQDTTMCRNWCQSNCPGDSTCYPDCMLF